MASCNCTYRCMTLQCGCSRFSRRLSASVGYAAKQLGDGRGRVYDAIELTKFFHVHTRHIVTLATLFIYPQVNNKIKDVENTYKRGLPERGDIPFCDLKLLKIRMT